MNTIIRKAGTQDIGDLKKIDPWPKELVWRQKIAHGEVIVLEVEGQIAGLLRYSVLWTTVPFIGLIEIKKEYRGNGFSRLMLDFLKDDLRQQGYRALLSSSQTDEPEPQRWHVHMGFHTNGIIENIADDHVGEIVYRMMLDE